MNDDLGHIEQLRGRGKDVAGIRESYETNNKGLKFSIWYRTQHHHHQSQFSNQQQNQVILLGSSNSWRTEKLSSK